MSTSFYQLFLVISSLDLAAAGEVFPGAEKKPGVDHLALFLFAQLGI
jgi:hypothetical protein